MVYISSQTLKVQYDFSFKTFRNEQEISTECSENHFGLMSKLSMQCIAELFTEVAR